MIKRRSLVLTMIGAVGLSVAIPAEAADPVGSVKSTAQRVFLCNSAQTIKVMKSGRDVIVQVGRRVYPLKRKPFSLGERFTSPAATLIIDSGFAAFVSKDEGSLEGCYVSSREARL